MTKRMLAAMAACLVGSPMMVVAQDAPAKQVEEEVKIESLGIGDKAPMLHISNWVKGAPVTSFEEGRVYVVECWATWCGPCIAAFPHLTELQKEYKDHVTVIGVNIWESKPESVPAFVEGQGDRMGYTVAMEQDGLVAKHWMEPAGRTGIPSAFIVDQQGMVAWMGHPMEMDKVLKQVVEKTWDLATAKERAKREVAFRRAALPLQQKVGAAARAGRWEEAVTHLDAIIRLDSELALNELVQRFLWTHEYINVDQAVEFANANKAAYWDEAMACNAVSWTLLTGDDADKHAELALEYAKRACDLSEWKEPMILDTVAKAYADTGDLDNAIKWQQKAVDLLPEDVDPRMKVDLEERLDEYRNSQG